MRRVARRVLVHATNEHLPARLFVESQLAEDLVQTCDYRPIILIVRFLSRDRYERVLGSCNRCQESLMTRPYIWREYGIRILH